MWLFLYVISNTQRVKTGKYLYLGGRNDMRMEKNHIIIVRKGTVAKHPAVKGYGEWKYRSTCTNLDTTSR